jgi:N-alpha-acetyl-L-2,4-diaminobutyrate deacetylase
VECDTAVRRGETVGLLHDFDNLDEEPWPCVAALERVVLAWAAPVPKGQHIVVVAREIR